MTTYVGNAFSLSMLSGPATLHVSLAASWVSVFGHTDIEGLAAQSIGFPADELDVVSLVERDIMIVAQYIGPRLPEGATELPEGGKIQWYSVRVAQPADPQAEHEAERAANEAELQAAFQRGVAWQKEAASASRQSQKDEVEMASCNRTPGMPALDGGRMMVSS